MTDDELDAQLGAWEVSVGAITGAVMAQVEATPTPSQEMLLAELIGEVRALRQGMQQLHAEVASLRSQVTQINETPPATSARIKGYPLLPFASAEETLPFFH